MSLRRFTSVKNLRGIGRPLLKRFFEEFQDQLKECDAKLPPDSLDDEEYFKQLAVVFFAPKELPRAMTDVLNAIVEMANESGVESLCRAAKEENLSIDWEKKATDLDIVMQVWLEDPELMVAKHNEHRLVSTTKFQYWGTKTPPTDRLPFTSPTEQVLELAREAVDTWCADNHRGKDTVEIIPYELDDEWWFLIQHGGMMTRLAESKGNRKTETLFYRPGKDDVVVYNVERDELRIHASSKGERELYRAEFGQRLRGDPQYFSQRKNFVLDPLRDEIDKALDPEGLPDINRIVLQEIEMYFGGDFDDRLVRKSDDMVMSASQRSKNGEPIKVIKDGGALVRATFEIEFANSKKPRKVYLRPPDELRIGRHGDLKAVHAWLNERKFRAANGQ